MDSVVGPAVAVWLSSSERVASRRLYAGTRANLKPTRIPNSAKGGYSARGVDSAEYPQDSPPMPRKSIPTIHEDKYG
eukprot:scaffold21871_cov64-Phaeocystis_antarctica.AAC.3